MKYKLCSLLLLTAFSGVVQAGVVGANIDSTLDKCKKNAISTIDSQHCYEVAIESWDNILGHEYSLLMKDLPENVRISIRDSQRQWIKYRDSYNKGIEAFYQKEEGTIWSLVAAESKMNVIRDKALDLHRLRNSTNLGG